MNIIFFGSSDYCLPILNSLISNFELSAVVTKQNSSVQKFAQQKNTAVFTPNNKEDLMSLKDQMSKLKPHLAIVADFGLLIPKEIFEIPKHKTLNIHFSRLPKFRGPSPVQYTILLGEKSAWISIIILDEEIDTGDIVWQKEISLMNNKTMLQCSNETTGSLYKKLFETAALELPDVINRYVRNELKPQKQDDSQATYTKHFTRADGFIPFQILAAAINWKSDVSLEKEVQSWQLVKQIPRLSIVRYPLAIARACRALSPWPGLWTEVSMKQLDNDPMLQKKRLKILKLHLEMDNTLPLDYPSRDTKVVGNLNIPVSSPVKLVLDEVQLEGKKPVSWKQFLEGYPDFSF